MIAFLPTLSFQELFLLGVIGLLLFGRNLPDAGRSLGRVVAQLKRSFHDFKDQLDRDGEIRDVKKVIQDTAKEVKNVAKVPRAVTNPGDALRDLTHEAMSSPIEDEDDASQPDSSNGEAEDATSQDGNVGQRDLAQRDLGEGDVVDGPTEDATDPHPVEDLDKNRIQP